ncbi:bile acid:sodium symporter family protein [Emticicia sp. BO119]|uniref:bile acid:sodium symporter family protein n=1 Tax=Emticicia sp. BO119 TaxID=2757768 RepID=UPI0015F0046D|nr:bile acid:sodium symporter family protein [Emticicia sp. BO119]MBA4852756.1 bile acid:sodium symporter family protein [Emticicia sp. BO119]
MRNYIYTLCLIAAVSIAYFFPEYFIEINGFQLKELIIPLLQIIMFGMGTTMSYDDFLGVIKMPKAVIIGLICQFTIMPILGFAIANMFDFPPEIAAGIILVGSSPSGLASNVISYISKANVALSITITSIATILAPLLTPFLMKLLGGQFIDIAFWPMVIDICKMIIVPIAIGFLINKILKDRNGWLQKILPLISMGGITIIIIIITAAGQKSLQTVGLALVFATVLHNVGGFMLGYWGARLFKLPEQDCRTVAIEVGLQNAGLASGLAKAMGKLATVGVAPALFGPIMNITGSLLASYWSRKSVDR